VGFRQLDFLDGRWFSSFFRAELEVRSDKEKDLQLRTAFVLYFKSTSERFTSKTA
jgi:hypothetical protein